MIVSFDFDDTLANNVVCKKTRTVVLELNHAMYDILLNHYNNGDECIILTARDEDHFSISEIDDFLIKHNLYDLFNKIIFTNNELKGRYAKHHNVDLHYDDNEEQLNDVMLHGVKPFQEK